MAGQGAKGGGQVAMPAAQAMGGPPMPSAGMRGSSDSGIPAIPTMDPYRRRPLQGAGSNGYRGPTQMGPQAALGGPSIVMPNGMSSGDVNMGGNVSVATGPIDTGLGAEAPLVGQRPRITDAMGNPQGSQMFGVVAPIEGTAEAGGVLSEVFGPAIAGGGLVPDSGAGPLSYLGGAVGGILPNVVDAELESAGSQVGPQQPIVLPSSGAPMMRPNPNALTAMQTPPSSLPVAIPQPPTAGGLKGGIFGQQPRPMPQPSQAQYAPLAPQGQFNVNQAAAGALQQAMGATQQGLGFTPMGIRPTAYRPSQIAGTSLAPYTNPYESQVVQQTMRDIGTAQEQALNLQGAQAQRAGAFGGSRQGIAEAETRLGYGQQALDAASRLRQQGYQTALGLAGQDVGAQTAAAQFAAQQQASAQAQNLAAQQAAMGMRLNAAQQLAGLGQQAFGTGQAIQQQQMQQGLLQQMLQQSLIDAAKAQYAGYTGAPSAALAAPLAALGQTPTPQTTTQTKQPGLFDYLRLGATAYGMS